MKKKSDEGKFLSGPVFISRLSKGDSIIYNLGDVHLPLGEQNECSIDSNSLYVHQHLDELFEKNKNKKYNFYLETDCSYGKYYGSQNNTTQIYLNQMRRLFHSYIEKKKKKKNLNVNLIAFDERLNHSTTFSKYALSSLMLAHYTLVINIIVLFFWVVSLILLLILENAKETSSLKRYKVPSVLVLSLTTIYLFGYLVAFLSQQSFKRSFLKSYNGDKYMKALNFTKLDHVKKEYKDIIYYMETNNNPWQEFLCCTFLIDLWAIENMLKRKEKGNINIFYSGLSHSDHIMFFLMKNYKYKLTHVSESKEVIKNIEKISKNYNIIDLIQEKYEINYGEYIQCSKISNFPLDEFFVKD